MAQEAGSASIRAAALEEFARCGFSGARIEAIARAAGVAKPLIYYHFSSKEELWRASLAEAFEGLKVETQQFSAGLQTGAREVAIDDFARAIVAFSANNPWLVRIAVDETRQGGERADWLKQNYLIPLQKMLIPAVEAVFLSGKRAPARFAAHVIPAMVGAINFPFIDADVISEVHHIDVFSEQYITQHVELVGVLLRACVDRYA